MSKCRNESVELACFTQADGSRVNLFANHVYDKDGVLIALYYSDDAGAIIDTTVGSVTPGSCPITPPDVEWEQLCDVQDDGTTIPFMCRTITSFDPNGDVIDPVRVDLFELDKVTQYTLTGEAGKCDGCPDSTPLGLITDLALLSS